MSTGPIHRYCVRTLLRVHHQDSLGSPVPHLERGGDCIQPQTSRHGRRALLAHPPCAVREAVVALLHIRNGAHGRPGQIDGFERSREEERQPRGQLVRGPAGGLSCASVSEKTVKSKTLQDTHYITASTPNRAEIGIGAATTTAPVL